MTIQEEIAQLRATHKKTEALLSQLEKRAALKEPDEPKYKPGDHVKIAPVRPPVPNEHFSFHLPKDRTITLGNNIDQTCSRFAWRQNSMNFIIKEYEIECLLWREPEPKAEVDWSEVPMGTLVEVRHNQHIGWHPAFYNRFQGSDIIPHYVQCSKGVWQAKYRQCRLYEGPGALRWRDWSGGECPVPDGKWCVIQYSTAGEELKTFPTALEWKHRPTKGVLFSGDIIKYAIIEPPVLNGEKSS